MPGAQLLSGKTTVRRTEGIRIRNLRGAKGHLFRDVGSPLWTPVVSRPHMTAPGKPKESLKVMPRKDRGHPVGQASCGTSSVCRRPWLPTPMTASCGERLPPPGQTGRRLPGRAGSVPCSNTEPVLEPVCEAPMPMHTPWTPPPHTASHRKIWTKTD